MDCKGGRCGIGHMAHRVSIHKIKGHASNTHTNENWRVRKPFTFDILNYLVNILYMFIRDMEDS